AIAENIAAAVGRAGLDAAPARRAAAAAERARGPAGEARIAVEALAVEGRRGAAGAGVGRGLGLGGVGGLAAGEGPHDVVVGRVAGQAAVGEGGGGRDAHLRVRPARGGGAQDVVLGGAGD